MVFARVQNHVQSKVSHRSHAPGFSRSRTGPWMTSLSSPLYTVSWWCSAWLARKCTGLFHVRKQNRW